MQLEHDPDTKGRASAKWKPVSEKDHARSKIDVESDFNAMNPTLLPVMVEKFARDYRCRQQGSENDELIIRGPSAPAESEAWLYDFDLTRFLHCEPVSTSLENGLQLAVCLMNAELSQSSELKFECLRVLESLDKSSTWRARTDDEDALFFAIVFCERLVPRDDAFPSREPVSIPGSSPRTCFARKRYDVRDECKLALMQCWRGCFGDAVFRSPSMTAGWSTSGLLEDCPVNAKRKG
ncbi:hypothetical protein Nwi_0969 [Nitrobacter winogradskyi Nb-255]|uniref:Uncharacterized protein n=1 Tax=Nitrobacter winogradskyi (strain ATCC 25391 / DSM 10237 / CIP 104748 / NCIMB 11846 / Nb-255) TaxID=323098 RepID=Q3SU10_NITWN|nr:hypothetical protein [Nitrobacter winogradskyi]ABA04231.1 hypothetical protein Nwi_0969 [Nitrobacter winogradskyi Nb-255]